MTGPCFRTTLPVRSQSRHRLARWRWLPLSLVAALLGGCGSGADTSQPPAPAGAKTNARAKLKRVASMPTNAPPQKPTIPRSVFIDDFRQGIDPFFPNSTRRQPKAEASAQTTTLPAPRQIDPYTEVVLNGILGTAQHRVATINDRPFETGEVGEITLADGHRVRLRCLEINENSVVVALEATPERKETIHLRKEP